MAALIFECVVVVRFLMLTLSTSMLLQAYLILCQYSSKWGLLRNTWPILPSIIDSVLIWARVAVSGCGVGVHHLRAKLEQWCCFFLLAGSILVLNCSTSYRFLYSPFLPTIINSTGLDRKIAVMFAFVFWLEILCWRAYLLFNSVLCSTD